MPSQCVGFLHCTVDARGSSFRNCIGESEPTITDLLPQNAVFLNEILDHVLLPLIQPARNGYEEK
jgi:hypothetical protein